MNYFQHVSKSTKQNVLKWGIRIIVLFIIYRGFLMYTGLDIVYDGNALVNYTIVNRSDKTLGDFEVLIFNDVLYQTETVVKFDKIEPHKTYKGTYYGEGGVLDTYFHYRYGNHYLTILQEGYEFPGSVKSKAFRIFIDDVLENGQIKGKYNDQLLPEERFKEE